MTSWTPRELRRSLGDETARTLLRRSIEDIGLSRRTVNNLLRAEIDTIGDILRAGLLEMSKVRNVGTGSTMEVAESLARVLPPLRGGRHGDRISNTDGAPRSGALEPSSAGDPPSEFLGASAIEGSLKGDATEDGRRGAPSSTFGEILAKGLSRLAERDQIILARRFPRDTLRPTLESIAADFAVSRERIRQIIVRATKRLGDTDDVGATLHAKLDTLLTERQTPALLEMLETEDGWFSGIDRNPALAAHLISIWSDNSFYVWRWDVRHIVTRIAEHEWTALQRDTGDAIAGLTHLKLAQSDVALLVQATARQNDADDLSGVLFEIVQQSAQYGE